MRQLSLLWVPVAVQRGQVIRGIKRDNVAYTHTFHPRKHMWPIRFKAADEIPVIEADRRQQISDACLLADKHVEV